MTVRYLSRSLTFSSRLSLAGAPDPSSSVQVLLGLTFSAISNMQIERSRLFFANQQQQNRQQSVAGDGADAQRVGPLAQSVTTRKNRGAKMRHVERASHADGFVQAP